MNKIRKDIIVSLTILSAAILAPLFAQESARAQSDNQVPVSTQWVLDAAGPTQRNAIKSVYLLYCPKTEIKGTAFLIGRGILVTDNHVVEGCSSGDLAANSPMAERITFSKMVTDPNRDLALLKSSQPIEGGLKLGDDVSPKVGTAVTTWGFPLVYNGPAPLLSVGYVAGYESVQVRNKTVKHIVVNGAFNPGNSGGPLLLSGNDTVVGIVVWKMRLLPAWIQTFINQLSNSGVQTAVSVVTLPDGTQSYMSREKFTAAMFQEFYNTVQVMIGEATSVSELKEFLHEKEKELQ
jgi:S1-C subfamily serine protease